MLDQIAVAIPDSDVISSTEIKPEHLSDICLWRNEKGLQAFMENLYEQKKGMGILEQDCFVQVTAHDLNVLEKLIDSSSLPVVDSLNMNDCIQAMHEVIQQGLNVFYTCSW
jgi:hypothetical protein